MATASPGPTADFRAVLGGERRHAVETANVRVSSLLPKDSDHRRRIAAHVPRLRIGKPAKIEAGVRLDDEDAPHDEQQQFLPGDHGEHSQQAAQRQLIG